MEIPRIGRKRFLALSPADKDKYLDTYPTSSHRFLMDKPNEASIRNVYKTFKNEVDAVADELKAGKREVAEALAQPSVNKLLSASGKGLKHLTKSVGKALRVANSTLRQSFIEMDKAGAFDQLRKGTMKVDEFLNKYPTAKKVGGPLIAGALVYQWLNMSFSGDFDDDFDVAAIGDALSGNYSLTDTFASPDSLKAWTQLGLGIATGGVLSFPWHKKMNIMFAAVYTGAKKAGNKSLAQKAQDALKKAFMSKPKQEALASNLPNLYKAPKSMRVSLSAGKIVPLIPKNQLADAVESKILETAQAIKEGTYRAAGTNHLFNSCHAECAKYIGSLTPFQHKAHYLCMLSLRGHGLIDHSIVFDDKRIRADSMLKQLVEVNTDERYMDYRVGGQVKRYNIIYMRRLSNIL